MHNFLSRTISKHRRQRNRVRRNAIDYFQSNNLLLFLSYKKKESCELVSGENGAIPTREVFFLFPLSYLFRLFLIDSVRMCLIM
jgi:hypothetical protein